MEYGRDIARHESFSLGLPSGDSYFASLLMDEIISENVREVRRLLKVHGARADVVVPERGTAALHVLAGLEAEEFAADVVLRVLRRRPGADLDVRSDEGLTPAHVAATYGHCRVLEVLLTNGADPSLVDYRLLLDAKGHAYKERQWQAFTMLTTYKAILECEERFYKYLESKDEWLRSDPISRTDRGLDACRREPAPQRNRSASNSNGNSNETKVLEWLKKTAEVIPRDENSINVVKNHSKHGKSYKFPVGKEEKEESIHRRDDKFSGVSESKLGEIIKKQVTKQYLEDKQKLGGTRSCMKSEVNNSKSRVDLNTTTKPSLGRRPKHENDVESFKRKPSNSNRRESRESEVCVYGYAESSLKWKSSRLRVADSTVGQTSDEDRSKGTNSNVLCKMSRRFLIVLKKRHNSLRVAKYNNIENYVARYMFRK